MGLEETLRIREGLAGRDKDGSEWRWMGLEEAVAHLGQSHPLGPLTGNRPDEHSLK